MQVDDEMVQRFLTWPLPASVCVDLCATKQGVPHRTGASLLSASEAGEMLEYVLRRDFWGRQPKEGGDAL